MKFALVIWMALAIQCGVAQTSDKQQIMEISKKFSADFVRRDFKSMADAYTDDAVILPPGRDLVVGKDSVFAYWSRSTSKLVMHNVVSESLTLTGDEAHDFGYYFTQVEENGVLKPVQSAKYYIVWSKTKSGWKMKMDMWNSRDRNWKP